MSQFATVSPDDYQQCFEVAPKVVETKLGPIEYAERGEGPVLITVHGGPGGFDQGLCLGEVFRKNGFKVTAISRPGYLGTPLASGASLEAQADLLAAFIETLGLGRVAVLGASAGGPASYLLAQRHPGLVAALIELDAVATTYTKSQELSKTEEFIYLSKAGMWLMGWFMRHFPAAVVKGFLQTESTLGKHELGQRVREVVGDESKLALVEALTRTMCESFDLRKPGVQNDIKTMEALDKLPLDQVSCPALIIHGDADGDVEVEQSRYAHQAIAGSELYLIKNGSHIGFWLADTAQQAQQYAVDWLKRQMGMPG